MSGPTECELDLISELKERIQDLDLDQEYLQAKNLVRFLRARGSNLSKAEDMIRKNVEWLETWDIKNALSYVMPLGWDTTLSVKITGYDFYGGPVVVVPVGLWDPTILTGLKDEYIRSRLKVFETVYTAIRIKSKYQDHMNQFTIILDLNGLGWRHYSYYDGLYGTLTLVKFFEANYPETLRVAYLINAPSMFSLFWKLLKPLVSDETHAKINFLNSDVSTWKDTILKVVKEDQLPIRYGGSLSDDYELSLNEIIGGNNKSISQNGNEIE